MTADVSQRPSPGSVQGGATVHGRPRQGAILFLALLAGLWLAYHGTVAGIVSRWDSDGGYSHGWLILGLVGWILWERRQRLFSVVAGARWPGFVLGVGAGAAWLAGDIVSVQAVQQLAVLGMMVMLPLVLFGWRGGLPLAGAMALLVFTIPVWEAATPLLQGMTITAVSFCLELSRVTAYIVDNVVTLPAGQFRIVEGCSGKHFFVSGFALASVYAYLYLRTWTHRAFLVGVTLAVAILANWLRVYIVIVAGYLTDMQHFLVKVDHYFFGWVMFGLCLIPVFFFAMWLERREERAGLASGATLAGGAGLTAGRMSAASAMAIMMVLAAPAASLVLSAERATESWCPRALPEVSGWTLRRLDSDRWRPVFDSATLALGGTYERDGIELVVWNMFYEKQAQGQELIFYANRPFDPERWRVVGQDGGRPPAGIESVSVTLESPGEQRRRLVYWYEVGGRVTDKRWLAKALQVPALIQGRADAAFLAVSAACRGDCDDADAAIAEFLAATPPGLTREPVALNCQAGL